jgi:hypothetical protein
MRPPQQSTIAVCGIARNVGIDLEGEIARIRRALIDFRRVYFVVVESLSADRTVAKLRRLAENNPNFYYESVQHSEEASIKRSMRLAEARNRALEIQRSELPQSNYIYVVDLDGVNRDLDCESIRSCFRYSNWDVMTSNQPKGYYDILALRHHYWNSFDWGEVYQELRSYMPDEVARDLAVFSKSIKLPRGGKLVPVESAFGGGAIYTSAAIENFRYSGLTSSGAEVCEHVPLNLAIHNNGGNIYINPDFVNVEHLGRSHSLKKRIVRRAQKHGGIFSLPNYLIHKEV